MMFEKLQVPLEALMKVPRLVVVDGRLSVERQWKYVCGTSCMADGSINVFSILDDYISLRDKVASDCDRFFFWLWVCVWLSEISF